MLAPVKMRSKQAAKAFRQLVQPSLVAIYASHRTREEIPVQVGTGFLMAHNNRAVLVTAKHSLRGKTFKEPPAEKAVHVGGSWAYIGDPSRQLVEPADRDISVLYMDEFPASRCLTLSNVADATYAPTIITFGGFLARDFKRDGDTLKPAPRVFTNARMRVASGLVGLKHTARGTINTETGDLVSPPKPSGLSGGPMVDTLALIRGEVCIVGVFTEQSDGQARGEDTRALLAALAKLD